MGIYLKGEKYYYKNNDKQLGRQMKSIADIRLENTKLLMEEVGLADNRKDFADKFDMTYNMFSQYFSTSKSRKNIGSNVARKIEMAYDKPKNWLDVQQNLTDTASSLPQEVQNLLDTAPRPFASTPEHKESQVLVDLFDVRACCGDGSTTFEFEPLKKRLGFDHSFFAHRGLKSENCIMLYAKNDSMENYICDGDTVMIDNSETELKDGEVYAVWFADELMLKRIFKKSADVIILSSDNKKYRDREVSIDNGTDFRILGQVVYRSG